MSDVGDLQRPRTTARGPGRAFVPLRKAGVALLDYEFAVRHQLRAEFDRGEPDALVAVEGDLAPVVLLPGIFETWRFLRPLARHLHGRGHPVHIVTALERNLMSIADGARIVADYVETNDLRNVAIVAHSKGGLVAKYVMGLSGVGERVQLTVAVSTPFSGSSLARLMPFPSVRAMHPANEALRRLAAARDVNGRIVSVSGWFDPHIPNGSHLAGAHNVRLPVGGHFRILESDVLFECVDAWLDGDALSPQR